MKKIYISGAIIFICLASVQAQSIPQIEEPTGWTYYDGDEFNGRKVNYQYWGVYGDNYTKNAQYGQNNRNQRMAQTYRTEQITFENEGGNRVARITATRDNNPPAPMYAADKFGWWSGALSSHDSRNYNGNDPKYYPLFSRIEIKAKAPYQIGVWMSLWLRHRMGASMFEIDLEEFFVKWNKEKDPTVPFKINQSIHGNDNTTGKVRYNLNAESDRITAIDFNPEEDFHIYGVQIEPDIDDPSNHVVISFLIDKRIRSVWRSRDYGNRYNKFMNSEVRSGHDNATWDIAITGQIGASNDSGDMGVGYPEDNPAYATDRSLTPHSYSMDIDWVRVFTRTGTPLWHGTETYTSDAAMSGTRVALPASLLGKAVVGDRIIFDLKKSGKDKYPYLDLRDSNGKPISAWELSIADGDAKVAFRIEDETMLNKLKAEGCTVYGTGVTIFAASLERHNGIAWEGDKTIKWGEVLVSSKEFSGVNEGDTLQFRMRDVASNAKCYLRLNTKVEGQSDRPNLPSDTQWGHIINLAQNKEDSIYNFVLNTAAAEALKTYGLAVTGSKYNLIQVKVKLKSATSFIQSINDGQRQASQGIYNLDGLKLTDGYHPEALRAGVYIYNGKKLIIK
ncbi:family 16 glycosylhydrolase [Prevotella sp. KH2C16]|uniref:glycoside hydrolase family 16 protein n=1 Tax=Prevotella sp. KH2C16 TaxID=1855325 RepID=UPI0008E6A025|nr:family 16 glycosylhydrolase [Prevotella sp. KH2C16]SFG47412.1 Glycosyl hydrolases family 16 [Prevotella sp. KH2C16]